MVGGGPGLSNRVGPDRVPPMPQLGKIRISRRKTPLASHPDSESVLAASVSPPVRPAARILPANRGGVVVRTLVLGIAIAATAGCFNERSFPFRAERLVHVEPPAESRKNTRCWLEYTHAALARLLPDHDYEPLLTEDLTTATGAPRDVFDHFDKCKRFLHTGLGNLVGLMDTAQVTGDSEAIETPAPEWPGFEEVWVEVAPGVSISGRLGLATRDGRPIVSDCIVILPGLLGDNMRVRTRDICAGLRDAGFHAMSIEFRGHGQVEARYPDVPYNFGVQETADMLVVAEWLQNKPLIRRTGMIGFSWSANVALLAAWEDGRAPNDPCVSPRLRSYIERYDRSRRHFEAGVIAVSPTLDFEPLLDRLKTPHSFLENPVLSSIQGTVAHRIERKKHGPPTGSLRKLIEYEFAKSDLNYEGALSDGLTYLRLLPYEDKPFHPKLQCARIPVLIIHSANDPLAYANEIARFFADTPNPNVAGVMLHGGGHDGFAAYCEDYLYSLFLSFFDAKTGPRSSSPARCRDPLHHSPANH